MWLRLWSHKNRGLRVTQWPCGKGICIADRSWSRGRTRGSKSSQSPRQGRPCCAEPSSTSCWSPALLEVYKHCKSGLLLLGELVSRHATSEEGGKFEEVLGTRETQGIVQSLGGGQGGLGWEQGQEKGAEPASEIEFPWEGLPPSWDPPGGSWGMKSWPHCPETGLLSFTAPLAESSW